MSIKKAISVLDTIAGELLPDERTRFLNAADRMLRGIFREFAEMKAAIPERLTSRFGAALTDLTTTTMVSYGLAYAAAALHPGRKRTPFEAVGAEFEKALLPSAHIPGLLDPIAAHMTAIDATAAIDAVR